MPVTVIEGIGGLREYIGREVAVSDWVEVSQERINKFADATEDRQWIHIDVERASIESPFNTTIAHGFLTLSLLSELAKLALRVAGTKMTINYGLNRVRFVSPLYSGSRIRGRFILASIDEINDSVQATWSVTVECEGREKPCCVAEWLVRYYL